MRIAFDTCRALFRSSLFVVAVCSVIKVDVTAADTGAAAAKPVRESAAVTGSLHTFTFKTPAVDRSVDQNLEFVLDLKATTMQGGAKVDEVESKLSRRQTRRVTVLATSEGRVTKARVTYRAAMQEVSGKRVGEEPIPAAKGDQPISGKTYLVEREKPTAELTVTDEKGAKPNEEETRLVSNSMDAIGRDNILGKFLNGKTIRVGHTVEMPAKDANEMLGFDKAVGDVSKFELTLSRVSSVGEGLVAEFETRIELNSADPTGHSTRFRGKMVVEVDTCRSIEAEFAGPVSFVDNHGGTAASFQVFSVGALRMSVDTMKVVTAGKDAAPKR
jgi:ethanolamine utilization microcompartment shell protein EutS